MLKPIVIFSTSPLITVLNQTLDLELILTFPIIFDPGAKKTEVVNGLMSEV